MYRPEDGTPVEYFLDIVPFKKRDTESKYLALCIKDKYLQVGNIDGMGVDGATNFSGNWCSSRIKETCSTCSICHCHLLQLVYVEAAINTIGIKHVYTMLTWKYFHYFPKRAQSLKDIQQFLNGPFTTEI